MKLWEALKALDENPAKVLEAILVRNPWVARVRVEAGCYKFTVHDADDGDQIIQSLVNKMTTLDLDWHEVKQLVTWQEAIQAWAGGKTIKTESSDGIRTYKRTTNSLQSVLGGVTKDEIVNGKWYVED